MGLCEYASLPMNKRKGGEDSVAEKDFDPDFPFAGIRVVELAQGVAAPGASGLLAAYGADVVKVEDAKVRAAREATGRAALARPSKGKAPPSSPATGASEAWPSTFAAKTRVGF